MSWHIEWTERALKEADCLHASVRARVIRAIERFAETEQGDIKRLSGDRRESRLRVGDWRVRFVFDHNRHSIIILRILPRGRAYRD